jgi:hypothetical protein
MSLDLNLNSFSLEGITLKGDFIGYFIGYRRLKKSCNYLYFLAWLLPNPDENVK